MGLAAAMKRVLAVLALQGHSVPRSYIAGALWGDATEARASGSLRTVLCRLRATGLDLITSNGDTVELSPTVDVDVHEACRAARTVIDGPHVDAELAEETRILLEPRMCAELLPGWYEDWVLSERERHRQLTLHALEMLCEHLTAARQCASAVLAGLAAVDQEPLRESSQRALMKAYLAEGNVNEAIRCYRRYMKTLETHAMTAGPSAAMRALLAGVPTI